MSSLIWFSLLSAVALSAVETAANNSPVSRKPTISKAHYKLTYFDVRGRAEVVRLLLAAADQPFEDIRIQNQDWPAMKNSTPWGSLPFLQFDGKELAQTPVIVHYLANKHGLGGANGWEQALVDSVVMATMDLWEAVVNKFSNLPPSAQKTKDIDTALTTTLPTSLVFLDRFIAEHGTNGHAVGTKLTSADVAIFNCMDQVMTEGGTERLLTKFPNVKAVYLQTKQDDKIAKYLKNRK